MKRTAPLLRILLVATLYYLGAKLGFLLSISEGNASSVWPPSGMMLAVLLLGGYRLWPGILLGAIAANILNLLSSDRPWFVSVAVAVGIGLGGTSEALTGAFFNQRWIGTSHIFNQGQNIFKFVAIEAFSCMTSPTLGVISLCLGGFVSWSDFGYSWFTWWIGDVTGILVLTPFIVTWFRPSLNLILRIARTNFSRQGINYQRNRQTKHLKYSSKSLKLLEGVSWLFLIGIIAKIAFGFRYPVEYLMIPLLVWAAFRFGRKGATLAICIVSAIAVIGSVYGISSFIRSTLYESLLLLQAFISSITVTTLVLSAVISERQHAQVALQKLNQELELRVEQRTSELQDANQEITRLNERLKAENMRMSAELEITRQLQQMILPKDEELASIAQLEIAGFMEPADEVGGDYYDILQQDGIVKIGIGDVTGHGLESGVLTIMVQTAVRTILAMNETDPVKFFAILNQTIYDNIQRMNSDKNLTLALLDYQNGVLRLTGQHEEMIIVRSGGLVELIDTIDLGFPIGLEADITDFIAFNDVNLNSGDVVVLYTDGITEAEDINGVQYGLERLCEIVKDNWYLSASDIKDVAIQDVRRHIGGHKVYDDITLVILKQK